MVLVLTAGLASAGLASDNSAERPRASVDTTLPPASGRTLRVPAGGDLQATLDQAQPGDVVALEAGATYIGPFTLARKPGPEWITIRTSAPDGSLGAAGRRVGPAHAQLMPKLVAASGAVLSTAPGAHHYRLVGLEIAPREGAFLMNLVELGWRPASTDDLPHHIVIDRCYLHGDSQKGARRGVALNSGEAAVVDSYLADFKEVGADSQGIAGWGGPGPFKILNNYIEAAGENLMFGGADPSIRDLVPADIEIRQNHFTKPLAWKTGEPGYAGKAWTVKNLLELKNGRRVLIQGNLFEYNWAHAQNGFAILFTVRNQEGRAPWSVVEDVTFADNVVRHTGSGINILGRDDNHPSQPTRRIVIRNNLFADVGDPRWGGNGTLFQMLNGAADVVIEQNTALQTGSIIVAEGAPHERFVYRRNIAPHNAYGITGTGTAPGMATLERYFPGGVFEQNVIVGGAPSRYPRNNFFPPSVGAVGFAGLARSDYRLAGDSRYRHLGPDFQLLDAALGAAAGTPGEGLRRPSEASPQESSKRP
jgi:hypothetical protein